MPTLKTLLKHSSLQLQLLYGNAELSFHTVSVIEQPEAYVLARSLLIVANAKHLNAALQQNPCAVICLLERQDLAQEALALCEKHKTTLIAMPASTRPERVREEAMKALLQETALISATNVQNYLLETLESPKPERDLLEKLHNLTRANFVLYSTWGSVLSQAGIINLNDKASQLPEGKHQNVNHSLWVFHISLKNEKQASLIVSNLNDMHLALMTNVKQMLALIFLQKQLHIQTNNSQKEALFNEWLQGKPHDLALRLARYGFDTGIGFSVMIAKTTNTQQRGSRQKDYLDTLQKQGDSYLSSNAIPYLSSQRETHITWVINSANSKQQQSLHQALNPSLLGSSLIFSSYQDLHTPYQQAMLAADSLNQAGYSSFEDLNPIHWTLQQQSKANLQALQNQLLGKLKEKDKSAKLWRTLEAYLANPNDLGQLAERLNIHVNTLRYRLSKIESLINKPLSKPETLAQLYLAQQIEGLLESET